MGGVRNKRPEMKMVLTKGRFSELKTERGGFTRETLRLLGVSWPPKRGWKKWLIGSEVDGDAFLAAREARLVRSNGKSFNKKKTCPQVAGKLTKKQRKEQRRRNLRPKEGHWQTLTTTKQRLGWLKMKADTRKLPMKKRTKRKKRSRLRRWYKCECCGKLGEAVRHHIVPVSCGGPDNNRNIVKICGECHVEIHPWMKTRPVDEEWLEREAKRRGLTYD
jgi:hypothetical protein